MYDAKLKGIIFVGSDDHELKSIVMENLVDLKTTRLVSLHIKVRIITLFVKVVKYILQKLKELVCPMELRPATNL